MSNAIAVAASRIGITAEEYKSRLKEGLKWCTACGEWHPRCDFTKDASRGDGLRATCINSRKTPRASARTRFLKKIKPCGATSCIEWTGSKYPSGYGSFWFNRLVQPAHRVAWMMAGREIPNGLYVLHHCDNRSCVNVDHLFLGTHQDNMDDMDDKGRRVSLPGEKNPRSKLTVADVIEIRRQRGKLSQATLGRKYHVSKTAIRLIQVYRNWKHIREFPKTAALAAGKAAGR